MASAVSSVVTPNVACVWGANGISGSAMIRLLVEQSRKEWSRILCISRRPTQLDIGDDDRVYFISIDLLQATVDDLVRELLKAGGDRVTHVYYYAYIEKQNEVELDEVNRTMFEKVLDVTVSIAKQPIKCFSLQTGYKYYGVHKGGEYLAKRPYSEDAPRHAGRNFYFTQEDLLKDYAEKHHWNYVITRPNIIIGVSRGNFMNFAMSLALYACIQREKGQPLVFPGNEYCWNSIVDHSDAMNNAQFQLWASTNDRIQNEIFNIHNGDQITFRTLWSTVEKYFGFSNSAQTFTTSKSIQPGDINVLRISLVESMPKNEDTWKRLVKSQHLVDNALKYATWSFADFIFGRTFDDMGDMSKARRYGWQTTVDTTACYVQCFDQLKRLKFIPKD